MGLPPDRVFACSGRIVPGQHVASLLTAKLVRRSEQSVLSKPPIIRGMVTDGPLAWAGGHVRRRQIDAARRNRCERERRRAFQHVVVDDRRRCASIPPTERYPRK